MGSFSRAALTFLYITDAFWDTLGGKEDYCRSSRPTDLLEAHPPRLFACSNKTGTFLVRQAFESHD